MTAGTGGTGSSRRFARPADANDAGSTTSKAGDWSSKVLQKGTHPNSLTRRGLGSSARFHPAGRRSRDS